jgi:hypothetical protein
MVTVLIDHTRDDRALFVNAAWSFNRHAVITMINVVKHVVIVVLVTLPMVTLLMLPTLHV